MQEAQSGSSSNLSEKMMETSAHKRKRSWAEEEGTLWPLFLFERSLTKRRTSVDSGKALTGRAAATEGGNADVVEANDFDQDSSGYESEGDFEEEASVGEEGSGEEEASGGEEGSGEEEASGGEEGSGEEEAPDGEEEPGGGNAPGDGEVVGEGASTDEPIFMVLSDPDVLDCPICYLPLSIPVYQCSNGHTACSSCCRKLKNKCPSCSVAMGNIRNRALERIIQSTEVFCRYKSYGCQAKFSCQNRCSHEGLCVHAPIECPAHLCNFLGSSVMLSQHFKSRHDFGVLHFSFNAASSVTLPSADEELVILNEDTDWVAFIMSCVNKTIKIRCFRSFVSGANRFQYGVVVRKGSSYQLFRSVTENAVESLEDPPSSDFLQVPDHLFDSDGTLTLRVCMWKDAASVDVSRFIDGEGLET